MAKIGFIVGRRYLKQEMTTGLARALRERGVEVDILVPQDCQFEPEWGTVRTASGQVYDLNRYDLLLPRVRSPLGLALLSYAEAANIPIINGHNAVQKARNKTEVAVALAQAGIPTAPTILADDASVLSGLPDTWYPLILKTIYGDNGQGLRLIRKREELDLVSWNDELVLAQHYLPNDGFDLKLYACGSTVFASLKPSPFNGDPRVPVQMIEPDNAMKRVALQVGAALGLEIYGVDAIASPAGPVVIEVNDFPNFTSVHGAPERIADYVMSRVAKVAPVVQARPARQMPRPSLAFGYALA